MVNVPDQVADIAAHVEIGEYEVLNVRVIATKTSDWGMPVSFCPGLVRMRNSSL